MTATATRAIRERADVAWSLVTSRQVPRNYSEPGVPYFVAIEQVMDCGLEQKAALRELRAACCRSMRPPLMHRTNVRCRYNAVKVAALAGVEPVAFASRQLAVALDTEVITTHAVRLKILGWRNYARFSITLLAGLHGVNFEEQMWP